MDLPKRDGVNDRYYLIHKPDTDPEVLRHADQCIQDVLDGTARENHSGYPLVIRNQSGTPFLPSQLLERYLSRLPLKDFPYAEAVTFCDALRRLVGWEEIRYQLEQYIEQQVQERCFLVGERDDGFTVFPPCTVLPELRAEDVDEGLLRFACHVAICHTVYGQSFESLTTEHILGLVSQIRPDMVKQLKTAGSGKLPPAIQKRKTKHLTSPAYHGFLPPHSKEKQIDLTPYLYTQSGEKIHLAFLPLRSDCGEQFAPLFWERNCYSPELQEYQRIAVLVSLDAIHSDLLPQYLERAKQDGRSYLLEHAKRI